MSGLPKGWAEIEIGQLMRVVSGGTPPSKDESNFSSEGGIPWLTPADLSGYRAKYIARGARNLSEKGYAACSATKMPAGSVLFSSRAPVGYVAVAANEMSTNQGFKSFIPPDGFSSVFLYYYLKHIKPVAEQLATGTTFKELSGAAAAKLPLLVAPLPEQKRIADKLDSVLARVDACRDRLDRIPALVKRFRQSVLAAAISGRLTRDWREAHPASPNQAAEEVAARETIRAFAVRVRGERAAIEKELIHELPASWSWIENHRLAVGESNAICAGPFGTIFKAKDFRDSGVPIIFLRHVGAGSYLTHKPGFMDRGVWEELHQPYSVFGGELLVTKLGDPPGDACIYPRGRGAAMVTPDVMKMSVDPSVARTEYLMHYFNSPVSKKITESVCFGVTRLRIDLSLFKTFPVPLPPLAEQHEIVRRVETLFAFADRLEARCAAARKQAGQLTPALLAKAFRGELVPQDPADEPAAELLKRLAASRAEAPKARRGKPRVSTGV